MKKINFEVTANNLIDDLKNLYLILRPDVKINEIEIKEFNDGIVNSIVLLNDSKSNDPIVIRTYSIRIQAFKINKKIDDGKMSFKFINRDLELACLEKANELDITVKLIAHFNNGFIYKYFNGVVNNIKIYDLEIANKTAIKLAKLHKIDLNNLARKRPLTDKYAGRELDPFIKQKELLDKLMIEDDDYKEFRQATLPSYKKLQNEYMYLDKILEDYNIYGNLCICHNDLTLNNLLINLKEKEVVFIDFELVNTNYHYYDISFHLINLGGIFCEYFNGKDVPNDEFIKSWLKFYYKELNKSNIEIDNKFIDNEFKNILIYMLMIQLLMIQRALFHSFLYPTKLNMNLVKNYCISLYNDYINRKDKYLKLFYQIN